MKTVDTNEYVSVLKNLVEEGKEVGLLISGNSMAPFLVHQRDYIYFERPKEKLKPGDMVFYQRDNGQYIMHRIVEIREDGFYLLGDNQVSIEGPIYEEQIFAIVTRVKRKGKIIDEKNFLWKFFAGPWYRLLPLRRIYGRVYRKIMRTIYGQDRGTE